MLNYYVTGMRCDKMMTGENVSNDEWWWSYRTQIMMIALYTNYDDRHDDDDGIVCKWWWSKSSWLHRTQMMMIFIMMMIASWHQDNLTPSNLTPDNLTPCVKPDNFTSCIKTDNLTPRKIWHHGLFHVRPCSPTLCPSGAQNPWPAGALRLSHNWQNIPNTNIYIQVTHIPQLLAVYIQYKCISFTIPNHAPEGCTYTLQLTHISRLLAEYFQYLCIMSYSCLGYVSNRPRCQIVCFCKWC